MNKQFAIAAMLLSFSFASLPMTAYAVSNQEKAEAKKSGTKKKKTKKKKKAPGKVDFSVTNFLPFGVGQFMQGRPLMGSALGGGQAVMLYLYLDRKSQIAASNSDATATIAEIQANGGSADPETEAYLARNADYVTKTNTEANLCLLGFAGLWGVSVVEAVWDPFGSRKATPAKSAELEEMDDDAAKWAKQEELDRSITKGRFSAFALPTTDKTYSKFGITFEKSFR